MCEALPILTFKGRLDQSWFCIPSGFEMASWSFTCLSELLYEAGFLSNGRSGMALTQWSSQ